MNALLAYATTGKDDVQGWFYRVDSQIFYELISYQNQNGINGGAAEIGLHHGKSFIALCLGLVKGQRAYGIDLFDNQSLNLDGSGHGVRTILEQHLETFGIKPSSVVIDSRSSEDVRPTDLLNAVGAIRFFSIDGGHWRNVVHNDLELAENVLAAGGVIALDDFLRAEWPDVSMGYFDWYENSSKNIVPFAIGYNKLYLSGKEYAPDYKKVLEGSEFLRYFLSKNYDFCGSKIPIFHSFHSPGWGIRGRVYEYLKLYHPDLFVKLQKLRA